jgi:hypothetical protein
MPIARETQEPAMPSIRNFLGTAVLATLTTLVLVGASGCSSDSGDHEDGVTASSAEALSAGVYVVTAQPGTWMYTSNNQWLLIHTCAVVQYSPTPYDWGGGWVRVWYTGEQNYHGATLGQVQAGAIGHVAYIPGVGGCGA